MARHTPGPWRIYVGTLSPYGSIDIRDGEGKPVATAAIRKEKDANAKLIAAAPEVADALMELLGMIGKPPPGFVLVTKKCHEALRAAGRL